MKKIIGSGLVGLLVLWVYMLLWSGIVMFTEHEVELYLPADASQQVGSFFLVNYTYGFIIFYILRDRGHIRERPQSTRKDVMYTVRK
ncbi:hypothetical protein [Falsibacillus pallidus]|uniref:hypothetical protein n=1 Tax=Falsibacillus pallidus TaxID=493781 RepID=UPI003D97F291